MMVDGRDKGEVLGMVVLVLYPCACTADVRMCAGEDMW